MRFRIVIIKKASSENLDAFSVYLKNQSIYTHLNKIFIDFKLWHGNWNSLIEQEV